jgi:hypothetical protein
MIIPSLPAAASNSDWRRHSHPDCRATGGDPRDAEGRPGLVKRLSDFRHALGNGDHGAKGRCLFRPAKILDVGGPEPGEHRRDIMIVGIEVEDAFRMGVAFLRDDGLEQLLQ